MAQGEEGVEVGGAVVECWRVEVVVRGVLEELAVEVRPGLVGDVFQRDEVADAGGEDDVVHLVKGLGDESFADERRDGAGLRVHRDGDGFGGGGCAHPDDGDVGVRLRHMDDCSEGGGYVRARGGSDVGELGEYRWVPGGVQDLETVDGVGLIAGAAAYCRVQVLPLNVK